MLQKTLLVLIALTAYSVLACQPCHAQREKRGLLTNPKPEKAAPETPKTAPEAPKTAPSTPTMALDNATTTPKASPQPKVAPTSDQPVDLFKMAAENSAKKEEAAKKAAVEGDEETEDKPAPPPEMLTLKSDGILIKAAFFASPNAEDPKLAKVIVPVILLHDWGGSMNDMGSLAKYLQSVGHTVIVPDLRGHGGSVTMQDSNVKLNYKDFNRVQSATVKNDFEACKKQLVAFNNQGKLNISMLSVLAVGEMCPMAAEWAITDWSYPNVGGIKQGQDVQSLIFVSPAKKFQQMSMSQMVRHPLLAGTGRFAIPTLMIYSANGRNAKDADTLYRAMARKRQPSQQTDPQLRWAEQDLFELAVPGKADGTELLASNPQIFRFIGQFNFYKISKNANNFPWASRASE